MKPGLLTAKFAQPSRIHSLPDNISPFISVILETVNSAPLSEKNNKNNKLHVESPLKINYYISYAWAFVKFKVMSAEDLPNALENKLLHKLHKGIC